MAAIPTCSTVPTMAAPAPTAEVGAFAVRLVMSEVKKCGKSPSATDAPFRMT